MKHHSSRQGSARRTRVGGSRRASALRGRRSFLSTDPHNCLFAIKGIICPLFSFSFHASFLPFALHPTLNPLCFSFISTFASPALLVDFDSPRPVQKEERTFFLFFLSLVLLSSCASSCVFLLFLLNFATKTLSIWANAKDFFFLFFFAIAHTVTL